MVKYHFPFRLFYHQCLNYGYQYSLQKIINHSLRGKTPCNFLLHVIFLEQIKFSIII